MSAKKQTTILFVDDEAQFRNTLALSFQRKGYQVLTAANGNEAFEMIQKHQIDVVVSDIRMPGSSGIDLLDQAKEIQPQMPVILLVTGFADITTEEAYLRGAEALLSKPFKVGVLEDMICQFIGSTEKKDLSTAAKAELHFHKNKCLVDTKVISLGKNGMFVLLDGKTCPAINDEVNFEVVQQQKKLKGSGIIRWIRTQDMDKTSGLGVEFISVTEE